MKSKETILKTAANFLIILSLLTPSLAMSYDTQTYQQLALGLNPEVQVKLNALADRFSRKLEGKNKRKFLSRIVKRVDRTIARLKARNAEAWNESLTRVEQKFYSSNAETDAIEQSHSLQEVYGAEDFQQSEIKMTEAMLANSVQQRAQISSQDFRKMIERLRDKDSLVIQLEAARVKIQNSLNALDGRGPAAHGTLKIVLAILIPLLMLLGGFLILAFGGPILVAALLILTAPHLIGFSWGL